jgi:hypothetical protein
MDITIEFFKSAPAGQTDLIYGHHNDPDCEEVGSGLTTPIAGVNGENTVVHEVVTDLDGCHRFQFRSEAQTSGTAIIRKISWVERP